MTRLCVDATNPVGRTSGITHRGIHHRECGDGWRDQARQCLGAPRRQAALLLEIGVGVALFSAGAAHAHHASEAYVTLTADGAIVEQRVDVPLRDLDRELVLDADRNGEIRWGEIRRRFGDIAALVNAAVQLRFEGARCRAEPTHRPAVAAPVAAVPVGTTVAPASTLPTADRPFLERRSDGAYAVLHTRWTCDQAPTAVQVDYRLFADSDAGHRGLLRVQRVGDAGATAGASPAKAPLALRANGAAVRVPWAKVSAPG